MYSNGDKPLPSPRPGVEAAAARLAVASYRKREAEKRRDWSAAEAAFGDERAAGMDLVDARRGDAPRGPTEDEVSTRDELARLGVECDIRITPVGTAELVLVAGDVGTLVRRLRALICDSCSESAGLSLLCGACNPDEEVPF